jgi:hypothetical protein
MWAVVVLAGALLKTGMATRYLVPAFPALALMAGLGLDAILRARWGKGATLQRRIRRLLPPILAALALLALPALALAPAKLVPDWRPRLAAMRAEADARLPSGEPIAVLRMDDSTQWWDLAWCGFYLDRPGRALLGPQALPGHDGPVLVPVRVWTSVGVPAGLREVARGKTFVLAEAGR